MGEVKFRMNKNVLKNYAFIDGQNLNLGIQDQDLKNKLAYKKKKVP